jgi:hypothetical protein
MPTNPKVESCMCRSVGGDWEDESEYPCIRQAIMHSPVGCLRKLISPDVQRHLYWKYTGYEYRGASASTLFQVIIGIIKDNPDLATKYNAVLTPTPTQEFTPCNNEETSPAGRKRVGGTTARGGISKPPGERRKIVYVTGPIKPPWES